MPPNLTAPLPYPQRIVKYGFKGKSTVLAIQRRLNELGCGPVEEDGDFGKQTLKAVRLFQARFPDTDGLPLKVDGEVGSLTWAALFGAHAVTVTNAAPSLLLVSVLEFASTQVGVMEKPPGSNRGPQVDKYVQSVGLDPNGGFAWCVAFIYYCFEQASKKRNAANPMIRTAGVIDHWNKAGAKGIPRITNSKAIADPSLVQPGQIFVMDLGGGLGHSGLVERVTGGKLVTVEGNSNDGGSREGIGVFRRSMRTIASINKGFIDYSGA
ncbi:peptidoglycan-binding protein [Herbaspirillum sp. HC18]|nr:peptidoglycan-binding protein [Herbaspirillum sp. HC18]